MAGKITLEDQVKALPKNMGGIAKLVKDLKSTVEGIEKKIVVKEMKELKGGVWTKMIFHRKLP